MSVSSETYKHTFTGDSSTLTFNFTFAVFAEADVKVTKYTIADGSTSVLTLDSDYTVSLTDSGDSGGSITMIAPVVDGDVVPPSSDYKIILTRDLDYTQETDWVANDPNRANVLEDAVDKNVMLIQQLKEEMDRAVLQDLAASTQITFPTPSSSGYFYYDGSDYSWTSITSTDYAGTISRGADASKSASPSAGDVYYATDADKFYICHTAGSWTEYLGSIDEDDMSSDSDGYVPTQQSVKAYVDASVPSTLDEIGNVAALTPEQGDILYYDGSNWNALSHGTDGQFLKTQGDSANPTWANMLGSWTSKSFDTVYQASTDGFVLAYGDYSGGTDYRANLTGYTDGSNPPTTARTGNAADEGQGQIETAGICMPVKSGDYYKVTKTQTGGSPTENMYFIPLGS